MKINGKPEQSHAGCFVLCGSTQSNRGALKGHQSVLILDDRQHCRRWNFSAKRTKCDTCSFTPVCVTAQPGSEPHCCREGTERCWLGTWIAPGKWKYCLGLKAVLQHFENFAQINNLLLVFQACSDSYTPCDAVVVHV